MSEDLPFILEVEIPKGIPKETVYRAALYVKGSPIFICKYTKRVSALVREAIVQDGIMLLDITVIDKNLEENFNDIEFIVRNFYEVDPVAPLLGPSH